MTLKGIDFRQLRALLRCYTKLNAFGGMGSIYRKQQGKRRGLLFVEIMYALLGLWLGAMLKFSGVDLFTYSVGVHFMTFVIAGMVVTIESGHILFNANEEDVLGHRPIHPRTLILAKGIDLFGLTFALAMAMNLFPTIFGWYVKGVSPVFPLVHVVTVIMSSAFCASAIVFVYGALVRLVGRERFDQFAVWIQILMMALFLGAQQILPQFMRNGFSLADKAVWMLPLPPVWFASLDTVLATDTLDGLIWIMAAMGVLITTGLTWAAIVRLGSGYHQIVSAGASTIKVPAKEKAIRPARELNPLLRWWMPDPVEQAVFRLARAYMFRDRDIRMRLYPGLVYPIIFPFIAAFGSAGGPLMFIVLWLQCTLAPQILETLRMSANTAASEIFVAAPVESAGHLFQGCRKAALYVIALPLVVFSITLMTVLKPSLIGQFWVALPPLMSIPTLSLVSGLGGSYIPLSMPVRKGSQSKYAMGIMMVTMLLAGLIAGVSIVARAAGFFFHLLAAYAILLPLVHWTLTRRIMRRPFSPGAEEA